MKKIGISGVARSGKDTFAKAAERFLTENGLKVKRYALARNLKGDLYHFVNENFGFDIYHPTEEQKKLIRPLMVAYGCAQREATKGKYWFSLIDAEFLFDEPDIAIVTDIRFCEYEYDECHWIKEDGGKLIHITLISDGRQILPANVEEAVNNPRLISRADYNLRWESMSDDDAYQFVKKFFEDNPALWKDS